MSTHQVLLDTLQKAIKSEIEGYHFYHMAAASTQDPGAKKVFEMLAEEEKQHEELLKKQYQAFKDGQQADTAFDLPTQPDINGYPLFSQELLERAANADYEMTALSVGMQLEHSAQAFYRAAAAEAQDNYVTQMFETLATWEGVHYEALDQLYRQLKEEYWHENRFAPF